MSIEVIKKQIRCFLENTSPEVMAIKGDWGVGKTYSWKKFLKEYKTKISFDRYSYVSLFGVNSLEALKFSIFENVVKKELIGTEASLETFNENTLSVLETVGRKSSSYFGKIPFTKNFTPALESISFLSIKNTLICIDDLERKGNKLDVKDILGLISLLKEQKSCKIVLLLNDGEDGLDDYEKYREKVIDLELKFNPTSEECVNIAYSGDNWLINELKQLTIRLDIRNIRVLKKIQRLADFVFPIIEEYEEEVRSQVLHSLCFFSLCFYCSKDNDDIPTLEYATTRGYRSLGLGKKEEKTEIQKKWDSMMQHYQYYVTDELDLEIKKAVLTGYFVEDEVKTKALLKNKEVIASKSEGSFSKAWELYHYSFDENQDEVVESLFKSLTENAEYISSNNLNGTVSLFRELREDKKASQMIDIYIEKRKKHPKIFNLGDIHSNPFSGDIQDKEVRSKFKEAWSESVEVEDPKDVLERLGKSNGWNDKDVVTLRNTTSEQFYNIFKNIKNESLHLVIEAAQRLGNYDSQKPEGGEILQNVTEALTKIGGECEINKRRVKRFGIDIK